MENTQNEQPGKKVMTVGLSEPNENTVVMSVIDSELTEMSHEEHLKLLHEIDKELAVLQGEINDKIKGFIANHKYSGCLEIVALDKSILKITDEIERVKKIGNTSAIRPSYLEPVPQQYVFLVPKLHLRCKSGEWAGEWVGSQSMQPTRF